MAAPIPSSLAARRDVPPLPLLKTSFDDSLLQIHSPRFPPASRSTPNLRPSSGRGVSSSRTNPSSPSAAFSLDRARTKSTFLGLLNKSKSDLPIEQQDTPPSPPPKAPKHAPNFSRPSIPDNRPLYTQPVLSREPSHETREERTQDSDHLVTPTPKNFQRDTAAPHVVQDQEPPLRPNPPVSPRLANWTPPPLVEAYPQSTLHAELEDPAHHTLRLTRPKRKGVDIAGSGEGTISRLKTSRQGLRRPSVQRSISGNNTVSSEDNARQSVRKVYVLSKSGHILQYGGDGPLDRLPEKTLKLSSKSVAFASDAIPGKHWVIQVLQTASDNEINPFASEKSFLGRFLPVSKAKKTAVKSMLLVVDSPADMNKWLVIIRSEILKFSRSQRPPTPTRRTVLEQEASQSQQTPRRALAMSHPDETASLSVPPSPLKPLHFAPSGPASPTFLDSGYISSGTTLAGDQSSSRSSRYQVAGKPLPDSLKPAHFSSRSSVAPELGQGPTERRDSESTKVELPQSPPNTAIPPLTPSVTDGSFGLGDSPNQSHPSPDSHRGSPKSARSRKESPEALFFTPATTPMQLDFSQSKAKAASTDHLSKDQQFVCETPSSQTQELSPEHDLQVGFATNTTPPLRQIKSATGLPSLADGGTSYPSARLSEQSINASSDALPRRYPAGNAFAPQTQHTRKVSPPLRTRPPLPVRDSSLRPNQARSMSSTSLPEKQKKRASFRSKAPLPLQITSSATTPTSSQRTSIRMRDSTFTDLGLGIQNTSQPSPTTDRDSALGRLTEGIACTSSAEARATSSALQLPVSDTSAHSPTIPPSLDRPLRRPPSIQVRKDATPFLSNSRRSSGMLASEPSGTSGNAVGSRTNTARFTNKSPCSTLVPVVRPPIRGGKRASHLPRVGSAPPSKPPSAPLPPTPPQSNTVPAAQPIITH